MGEGGKGRKQFRGVLLPHGLLKMTLFQELPIRSGELGAGSHRKLLPGCYLIPFLKSSVPTDQKVKLQYPMLVIL